MGGEVSFPEEVIRFSKFLSFPIIIVYQEFGGYSTPIMVVKSSVFLKKYIFLTDYGYLQEKNQKDAIRPVLFSELFIAEQYIDICTERCYNYDAC